MVGQAKFEDSNIALIGSHLDIEQRLKAARSEKEWQGVAKTEGIKVWRIEKLQVKPVPEAGYGKFYNGDSYIVLQTYKTDSGVLKNNIFFWLGGKSSIDEICVAAYKTVELDDFLGGEPVEYREVEGNETENFLKLFQGSIIVMEGGVDTGLTRVSAEKRQPVLYHIKGKPHPMVKQVPLSGNSLNDGDVFVLDEGNGNFYIWAGSKASGSEKFKAAEVVTRIQSDRGTKANIIRLEADGNDAFWNLLGGKPSSIKSAEEGGADADAHKVNQITVYRLSDASGKPTLQQTTISGSKFDKSLLDTKDILFVDVGFEIFVWIGHGSSAGERKHSMTYAEYIIEQTKRPMNTPVVKMFEGSETKFFNNFVQ